MKNRIPIVLPSLASVLILSGCSTLDQGEYAFREGWREAEIVQIAPVSQISRPDYYNCVRKATPQQRADQEFAVVTYRRFNRTARSAMPLARNHGMQVGASVYADVDSCDGRIAPRQVKPS